MTMTDMLTRMGEIEDEADLIKRLLIAGRISEGEANKSLLELWREHCKLTHRLRDLGIL
jgi:hypothetical protein